MRQRSLESDRARSFRHMPRAAAILPMRSMRCQDAATLARDCGRCAYISMTNA
ncbi:hypothetical protein [Lysobacter gummosus]|uniref:hypothetical protein n=1 Tax=Lysobacter gummosus TaxID=262324 RepID=UPI00363D4810